MSSERAAANPFPGLRPFESDEAHLFFGRDGQIDEVLRRLRLKRFVAVVGTSGSGKSSLVRAGLLPRLHGGFMPGTGSGWRVTIFRPGSNPIGNLAKALNNVFVPVGGEEDQDARCAMTEATLRRGALGLANAVRKVRLPRGENLLIVVDQFEELFRFKNALAAEGAADDAAAFVKLLLEAACQDDVPIYVLLTMRSDFLGTCSEFRGLPEAINDSQYLIPRMTRDQRHEAITSPIAVGGAEIAPRLVNRLLNDVGDNPDQLPILQHALMRTWQQWALEGHRDDPLDLSHYEEIGGMAEAISRHADKAYNELHDERSRTVAEKLFKRLTGRGAYMHESRRPTRLREICAVAEASEAEVVSVIESFRRPGRSFLMPPAGVALHADTFIDISHESLTRSWKLLSHWVDDEALSARIFLRLADTAALYRQGEASLWRDPDLAIALAWRDRTHPNAAWGARYSCDFDAVMDFLEESQRARDAEIAERQREQEERERQRKKTLRLTQALAAVLLLGFLLSATLAVIAYQQNREADKRRHEAETSAINAARAEQVAQREKERAAQGEAEARKARAEAEDSAKAAQQSAEDARRSAKVAEQKAAETRVALEVAERAKEDAQLSAAMASMAQQHAEEQRRQATRLATRLAQQDFDSNTTMRDMADRLMQISTPRERAHWHFVKADALGNLKKNKEAIDELDAGLSINEGDPRALTSRSYQYLLTRQPEKVIEDAQEVITKNPTNAAASQNLVLALASLGRYDEARKYLRGSLESFMHWGYGEYSETEVAPDIQRITDRNTLFAESDDALTALHYERATLDAASGSDFRPALEEAHKRAGSLDAYLFALNWAWLHQWLNPKDYGVLAAQGALWERAGYLGEAKRSYEDFEKEHRKLRDSRYGGYVGWVRQRIRALPATAIASTATASAAPPDARALTLEATRENYRGHEDKARARFNEAVKAAPDNPDILLKRGWFLFDNGDYDGARADYSHILERAPKNANALLYHALSGLMSSDKLPRRDLRRDIIEARNLDPTVVPGINELNNHGEKIAELLSEGSLDDAVDFLERGAKYNEPSPNLYFLMAKFLNEHGRPEQALEKIRVAIEMKSDQAEYYKLMTQAEQSVRERARAKSAADRGAEGSLNETSHAEALGYAEAGDAKLRLGDTDEALDAYGRSLKVLDGMAKEQGVEGVRCEVETVVRKVSKIAEGRLTSKAEVAEFLRDMFGGLDNIKALLNAEINRLSASR